MLVFTQNALRRSLSAQSPDQVSARIKVQEHIAASVGKRCTARCISFRQFDRDTPLLAFTLRFVGTRRNGIATRFCVLHCGKDGRCGVGDRAGVSGSDRTDGQCYCNGKKLVGSLHRTFRLGERRACAAYRLDVSAIPHQLVA